MCTVLFIPQDGKFFFASLRDENPGRNKAMAPNIKKIGNSLVLAPVDPVAGGTWIGANDTGNVIVLLNGAFEKHERQIKYKKSRGLIVSELLESDLPVLDWNLIDMEGIEPYTLVVWSEEKLFQLVWDGKNRHRLMLKSDQSYIWSSSTLYSEEAKVHREELFRNWIVMNPPISKLSLFNFFKQHSDNQNGFIMNRNELTKTLSFSLIEFQPYSSAIMSYYDLCSYTYHNNSLELKGSVMGCNLNNSL